MGLCYSKLSIKYNCNIEKSDVPMFFEIVNNIIIIKYNNCIYHKFNNFLEQNKGIISWKLAECTINGIRNYHLDSRFLFKSEYNIFFTCSKLSQFMIINDLVFTGEQEFLKYEKGCFVKKHIDRMGEYTCLIFPSGYNSTGGELIIYKDGKEIVNFKPYNIKYDNMIIFPAHMEHEVLKVTSGERYVFKVGLATEQLKNHIRKENLLD